MDWLDLLAVQGTLKSLCQYHISKVSIHRHSPFLVVQLSHPYMTTGKTIALTRRTFVGKVMSLLFNMLSRLVITFLPRSKRLLISWLQSPSAVTLEPKNKVCHCFHCIERWYWWTYRQGCSGDADIENRLVDAVGEGQGGTNWESNMENIHYLR